MAKKINAETAETLKRLGINVKTEEEAHKKLIAILEKEGIEGMEDESLDVLINMVDGFINTDDDEEEEEVDDEEWEKDDAIEEDSDEEMDELAAEVEEDKKASEAETSSDDDEEEEEVEVQEAPKPTKKAEKTNNKKERKQKATTRQKLDPKNNPEDRKVLDDIKEMFGEDYVFDYVKSNGATVKHLGKNGKRGVILIENLIKHNNGTVTCNLFMLTMAKQTEILDELGINYAICWSNAPVIRNITLEEVKEILEKVFDVITDAVIKIDKRLGDNRKKMEKNLQKTKKKSVKKVKPDDEEEDDDEEEEEAPKPTKKKVVKKSKK